MRLKPRDFTPDGRDAYAFLDHLESLTEDEDNHFSRADVKDALR